MSYQKRTTEFICSNKLIIKLYAVTDVREKLYEKNRTIEYRERLKWKVMKCYPVFFFIEKMDVISV